jgi:hypothetical protein
MAWKRWPTTGEPEEPSFQEPELLRTGLSSLGGKVELTLAGLGKELHFFTIPSETSKIQPIPFAR